MKPSIKKEIHNSSKEELEARLRKVEEELLHLRVAKVSSPTPEKLTKLKEMKKEKAVILTVMRENELKAIKAHYTENNKELPKKMREKKARKLRKKLNEKQIAARLKVNGPKSNWSKNIKFTLKEKL